MINRILLTFFLFIGYMVISSSASAQEDIKTNSILIDKKGTLLSIYLPAKNEANNNRYIRIDLQYFSNKEKRTNLWRLTRGYYVERTEDNTFRNLYSKEFIYPGEWEAAIMTTRDGKKNPDFMGGFHGYEELSLISLNIDDLDVDMAKIKKTKAQNINFTQHSLMYEYGTNRPVAKHIKKYFISGQTIKLDQTIEWLETMNVETAYTTMLPIARSLPDGSQITDCLTIGDNPKVFDVSKSDKTLNISDKNVNKVSIWGKESGLKVDVQIENNPLLNSNKFFCSMYTPQDGYNKLYSCYAQNYNTYKGEIWNTKTTYEFNTK